MVGMDRKRLIRFILIFISAICAVRYDRGTAMIAFLAQNTFAYNFQLRIHFNIKFGKQSLHYLTVKVHNSFGLSNSSELFISLAV